MAELFKLKVVTPQRLFFEGEASFVEFVTTEGEMGVYPKHIPMTAVISPGVLRIHQRDDRSVKKAALISGFVKVLPDQVTILAETAEWPGEIDEERARRARERAEEDLKKQGSQEVLRAEMALKRALARLEARK